MKIFLLSRIDDADFDEFDAKIVRAKTENQARNLANDKTGDEGKIWTDPLKVDCKCINMYGDSEVLLSSYNAG